MNNDKEMVSSTLADQWLPVDVYIGGIEHGSALCYYKACIIELI